MSYSATDWLSGEVALRRSVIFYLQYIHPTIIGYQIKLINSIPTKYVYSIERTGRLWNYTLYMFQYKNIN